MFERLWTDYAGLIQFLSKQIEHSKDRTTTQDLVNTIYEIYTSLLNTCCEKTLGTYQPQQKQQNIDNSIPFLRSSMAHDTQFASLSVANEGNNSNSSQTTLPFPLWIALLSSMPLFTILRIRTASILLYTHAKTTLYLPTHSPLFARPQKLASTL
jgi:hypothetical protein